MSCPDRGFDTCDCPVPKVHVMPWGPMGVEVHGLPVGYTYKAEVVYDRAEMSWHIEVKLQAPPAQRHWAEGDS